MKIRIKGNSIRLRLTRSEVDTLAATGYVEERTEFFNSALIYALQAKEEIENLKADYSENTITVHVPKAWAANWNKNETVGFNHSLNLPSGSVLTLLIEKDFKCIDSDTNEDQSDNYDNPSISCE
jgi:hypothetical protein